PNGPLQSKPLELLQAYEAGQRSQVFLWLLSVAVFAAAAALVLWLRRGRDGVRGPSQVEVDLEAGVEPLQGLDNVPNLPPGLTAEVDLEAGRDSDEEDPTARLSGEEAEEDLEPSE
ncbi:unnamed protein product, partial [Symbiodinium necroappetens]